MSRELLERIRKIPTRTELLSGQSYKYIRLEEVRDMIEEYLSKPLPKPVAYAVYSDDGDIYISSYKQCCHNHINDAIDRGLDESSSWRVMSLYAEPPERKSLRMTNVRPTYPGWYWYELPGSWALQPALVFDQGDGSGLHYTLGPINSDAEDAERDGFAMDMCSKNARWSQEAILTIKEQR